MDPRRFLILAGAGLLLSGCAMLRGEPAPLAPAALSASPVTAVSRHEAPVGPAEEMSPDAPPVGLPAEGPVAEPVRPAGATLSAREAPDPAPGGNQGAAAAAVVTGPPAIAAANRAARAASRSDGFEGGMQVFAWSPGRVFEVWTAPLRVTTLTLGEGETLIARAAGDTVRWQIGEVVSGEGGRQRTHVLLKPLEEGLETNLVLTTNQRIYLVDLRSGGPEAFNTAVSWRVPAPPPTALAAGAERRGPDPVVTPQGPLDARYRIEARGRTPRWMPSAVFNDGLRTFIALHPDVRMDEAPALFVTAPDGGIELTNYRQSGGLFIVDRVIEAAELRLGSRRPQVVRIRRIAGDRP
jgi:type IV secretion system protein TrbG